MKTANFKKKKVNKADLVCYTYGEPGHISKECPDRADQKGKNSREITIPISIARGHHVDILPFLFLLVCPIWAFPGNMAGLPTGIANQVGLVHLLLLEVSSLHRLGERELVVPFILAFGFFCTILALD